jgi:hypothetical protein
LSAIGLTGSGAISPGPEEGGVLLLVKPPEEFLKPRIDLDFLDGIERIPQLVVRPGFVDKILAGVAGRCRVSSALASRDHVVPTCGYPPLTKCTSCGHATGPLFLQKHIHSAIVRRHSIESCEPLAGLFHQLTPSAFKNRNSARKGLGRSSYFAFRGSNWYARPVTLRIPALI